MRALAIGGLMMRLRGETRHVPSCRSGLFASLMGGVMNPSTRRRRSATVAIGVVLAAIVAAAPIAVFGATPVTSAWLAKVGSSGANGTVNVATVSTGAGSIGLKLVKLKRSATLPVTLYKGSCGSIGPVLFKLASIKTSSTGAASRTSALTAAQVKLVQAATTGTGKVAVRVGSGATAKCGLFAKRSVLGPQAVVQAFYAWYIAQVGAVDLSRRADLTPAFIYWARHYNDNDMFGADPVLCAQSVPDSVRAGSAAITGSRATVPLTEVFAIESSLQVTLALGPKGWQISAVSCGSGGGTTPDLRPDALIRPAAHGYPGKSTNYGELYVGDDVYNTTAAGQVSTIEGYSELEGAFYTFDIRIENDGSQADRYSVQATGAASTGWTVTYLDGATDITASVEAGTYQTASLAAGAYHVITARITIDLGTNIDRLVAIRSVADPSITDAVKFAYRQTSCGC
jgi:hypothetical protein